MPLITSNVTVPGGEIDLVVSDGSNRIAVEVRTVTAAGDPIDAVDNAKRRHVASLAPRAGCGRVAFLGVRMYDEGVDIHWVPK